MLEWREEGKFTVVFPCQISGESGGGVVVRWCFMVVEGWYCGGDKPKRRREGEGEIERGRL